MIFGLDSLFSICFSIPVVIIPRLKNAFFLISLGIGIAIAIVADLFSVSYPFSDFIVYVIAFSGGILLGRVFKSNRRFVLFLIILSSLDIAQILLTSGNSLNGASNTLEFYGNVVIGPPVNFKLGIIDALLICAIAEKNKLHTNKWWPPLLPGVFGLMLADLFALYKVKGGLPLIPFLTLGFVLSQRFNNSDFKQKGSR